MSSTSTSKDRLLQLLTDELKIFVELRKIVEVQSELLSTDDIEEFGNLLTEREKLIEKISGLQQEKAELMQSCDYVSEDDKSSDCEIGRLLESVREELILCAELNDEYIVAMRSKVEEHTRRIDDHAAMRKGVGGYVQAVSGVPEAFDRSM